MGAQPPLTKPQKYCLTFILALALTLAWTTLAHAQSPGDLDITFGGTGVVTTSVSSGFDRGWAVIIQPDNKIVVAGIGDSTDFAITRYNSDGSLDTNFNGTGIVSTFLGSPATGLDATTQPDGKIVVAGYINFGGFSDFCVARYNSDGSLDTDFNGGAAVTSIGSGLDTGWGVALQSDGKIVVAGESEVGISGLERDIAVVRYTITGTLDTGFNSTGIVTTRIASGFNGGFDVAIQPDNKIVVVGGSNNNLAVVRYTINGTLDTSFNGTGVVTTPIGTEALGLAVALQPDGKIVVSGYRDDDFAIVRYNGDGSLDTSFNGVGYVITPITNNFDFGTDLAIQPNGKLVVAGTSGWITSGDEGDITVARYNSDGSLDTTFAGAGILTNSFDSGLDWGSSVVLQPDGKIVVAGNSKTGGVDDNFIVLRYLGDGTRLSLTKMVDDATPKPGQVITYTLAISNSGNVTATNALISDTLPTGLTLAGAGGTRPAGSGYHWNLSHLG